MNNFIQIIMMVFIFIVVIIAIDIEMLIHRVIVRMLAIRQNQIISLKNVDKEEPLEYINDDDLYSKLTDNIFVMCIVLSFLMQCFINFGSIEMSEIFYHWKEVALNGYTFFIFIFAIKIVINQLKSIFKKVKKLLTNTKKGISSFKRKK
ncbi:MAG TPA: hypothetical protein GX707_07090 [Epulopiscium sp.]|nr:hypothetical protein [Candidatus Epulonipiscium sp.]